MVQNYHINSHLLIMEHSSNYGKISSSIFSKIKAESENNQEHEDDFFKSIKGFLVFGKLIGVLPFSGIFGNSGRGMSSR